MPITAHVHPRLGIGPFKKFEPYFIEAMRALPATTVITIEGGLSPSTICARMRDSLLGYRLNRWPQADLEFRSLYEQHQDSMVVRLDKDMRVLITPRRLPGGSSMAPWNEVQGKLARYIKTKVVADHLRPPEPEVLRIQGTPTVAQIANLATMKGSGIITTPITFLGDIRSDATRELEVSSDIVFHYDPERNETILM